MLISVFAIVNTSLCTFIVDLVLVQKMYSRENFSFKMLLATCAADLLENVKGALQILSCGYICSLEICDAFNCILRPVTKFEFNHTKALRPEQLCICFQMKCKTVELAQDSLLIRVEVANTVGKM